MGRAERALDKLWQDSHNRAHRYSDPPPDGVKPDPDYEPTEGEWFWWKGTGWYRYCRKENNRLINSIGQTISGVWEIDDKGRCLPATAPKEQE